MQEGDLAHGGEDLGRAGYTTSRRPHSRFRERGEKHQLASGWLLCGICHNDKNLAYWYKCQVTIPIKQPVADVDMNRPPIAPAFLVLISPLCQAVDFAPGFQSREMTAHQYANSDAVGDLGGVPVTIPKHFASYLENHDHPSRGKIRSDSKIKTKPQKKH